MSKSIKLTQEKFAIVSNCDYEWLSTHKWYALKDSRGDYYAVRGVRRHGKRYGISMARLVLGLEQGDKRQADHKNHFTLDNRRTNIRIATSTENNRNRKSHLNTTSVYKGVSWNKGNKGWIAQIKANGKQKHLGYFDNEIDAARAYDLTAIEHFGKFAYLNFPDRDYTLAENKIVQTCKRKKTSKYKGVSWYVPSKKWMARICINGQNIFLGYFELERDTASAYRAACVIRNGIK